MPGKRQKSDLKLKSIWEETLVEEVLPNRFHRNKIWTWLIKHSETCTSIADIPMKDWCVPKEAMNRLNNEFVLSTSTIIQRKESSRRDTTKLLIRLQDGHEIETVVMKHTNHATVCVSSQIGCQMGCKFCATGTMGIIGDLTTGEILEQLVYANTVTKIRNLVFMGMGEPLQNYENVRRAVLFMIDDQRYGLSPKQVTISTVGVLKNMRRLSDEIPNINLALSLHAPNQSIRLKIVPTASAASIEKLMDSVDYHITQHESYFNSKKKSATSRANNDSIDSSLVVSPAFVSENDIVSSQNNSNKSDLTFSKRYRHCSVMIEYILIKDINDQSNHAHELAELLLPRRDFILLNLIPYNPTNVAEEYHPPNPEDVKIFSEICQSSPYRIHTRVRQEMGQDIDGACGQLALSSKAVSKKKAKNMVDIEDVHLRRESSKPDIVSRDYDRLTVRLVLGHLALPVLAAVQFVIKSKTG